MDKPDPEPTPDPALVEAMRSRVVKRRTQNYANRGAGPGRQKGQPKIPGSGRKAGWPALWSPEFREYLNAKARPFEVLASICSGEEIVDADGPRRPTIPERMRAAETLARKLLPDLSATTLTGKEGGAVVVSGEVSVLETARRVAFLLTEALHEDVPVVREVPAVSPGEIPGEIPPSPEAVGDLVVSFVEAFPDGRQRWQVRYRDGRLVGSAFGRDGAISLAERTIT